MLTPDQRKRYWVELHAVLEKVGSVPARQGPPRGTLRTMGPASLAPSAQDISAFRENLPRPTQPSRIHQRFHPRPFRHLPGRLPRHHPTQRSRSPTARFGFPENPSPPQNPCRTSRPTQSPRHSRSLRLHRQNQPGQISRPSTPRTSPNRTAPFSAANTASSTCSNSPSPAPSPNSASKKAGPSTNSSSNPASPKPANALLAAGGVRARLAGPPRGPLRKELANAPF
jgi:hypothetical protein